MTYARSHHSNISEVEPLLGVHTKHESHHIHPKTITRIVTRISALTCELLPIQVDLADLLSPTSTILTKQVVTLYVELAGDFLTCLPYALLEARRHFIRQTHHNPSDADENICRALACEALARKVVARTKLEDQYCLLSARYRRITSGGEVTDATSALESAVDQHLTFFLSSNESQRCVFSLWKGLLVQTIREDELIEYLPYTGAPSNGGVLARFDPSRISVPRYQFFFRIWLWIIFVGAFSIAIQTPGRVFGIEDVVLYIQLLGYILEDSAKIWKIGYRAMSFWTTINLMIYVLLSIAFGYRVAAVSSSDEHQAEALRLVSFQFLSSAAPLIWMKLLTIFDLFQYFGTLQIVIWRMLKESGIFFSLLTLLAIGFGQALCGLDAADESQSTSEEIVHSLIQGLLGSPAFNLYERGTNSYPFGMILYYSWSVLTLVILLNILIALFGSAYSECTDESVPTFMAFFAGKTISAIRAPDTYVYVAPFNLIEMCIIPSELVLTKRQYAILNRYLMGTLFFIPLVIISIYETHFDTARKRDFLALTQEEDPFTNNEEDPEPQDEDDQYGKGDKGRKISTKSFEELKKGLPSLMRSTLGEILYEVTEIRRDLEGLKEMRKVLEEFKELRELKKAKSTS